MRKTRFTFFIILVILTAVLVFIIVGESSNYGQSSERSSIQTRTSTPKLDRLQMIASYQNVVGDILYEYQQQILQQSITREDAVKEIREKVLAIAQIPVELQDLHLRLVIALSRDLNGYAGEASKIYNELQSEYSWLFSRFNFLLQ